MKYRITNKVSGLVLGVFSASSKKEALDSLYQDAGYKSTEDFLSTGIGSTNELLIEELKYQVVIQTGNCWSDDFEGSEECLFTSIEEAVECCSYLADLWCTSIDNWGFVETDKNGCFYDHDVERVR